MNIVIYSESDLSRDPRVLRQIRVLSEEHCVIPVGYNPPSYRFPNSFDLSCIVPPTIGNVKHILRTIQKFDFSIVGARLLLALFRRFGASWLGHAVYDWLIHRRIRRRMRRIKFQLIIGNDLSSLRLLSGMKRGILRIYDAHEYSPGQFDLSNTNTARVRYVRRTIRKHIHKVDAVTTVAPGIAYLYERVYGISKPYIVTNAAEYQDLQPTSLEHERIRMVHHGIAVRSRQIELMINTAKQLDSRFILDLYLLSRDDDYLKELKISAKDYENINFQDPVPANDLPRVLNRYDIGLYILPPTNLNQLHALPNKFFDFIQARLAIAVGPSREMARIVCEHGIGVVASDFSSRAMKSCLSNLTSDEIMRFKYNSHRQAFQLSAEVQSANLRNVVATLV
jgi:hypothetical protein